MRKITQIILLIIFSFQGIRSYAQVCFSPESNFSVGAHPYAVCTGDFNGDGIKDLATANYTANNVSVFLGIGSGNFGIPVNYAVGNIPQSITCADFNGDGKLDLAVANVNSDNVSILLGTGSGSFGLANNFTVGNGPISIISEDFNSDGHIDIAVADYFSNNVSILIGLGTGSGSFGSATNFAIGTTIIELCSADFNGDGNADLATTSGGDSIAIVLGNGAGNFGAVTNLAAGYGLYSIIGADFNGDGKNDLVVADQSLNRVSVLINGAARISGILAICSGDNTILTASGAATYSWSPNAGNASTPTVTVSPTSTTTYTVTYSNGTCPSAVTINVTIPPSITIASSNTQICLGSDVTLTASGSSTYKWSANAGNATTASVTLTPQSNGGNLYTVTDSFGCGSESVSVNVNADVSFSPANLYMNGSGTNCLISADFNGDGFADLAANFGGSSSTNITVSLGNGNGSFGPVAGYVVGTNPISITNADFNGDGHADLAVVSNNIGISSQVSILLGTGTGSFGTANNFAVGPSSSIASADFNGDGKADLAVTDIGANNVSVLLGTGTGTFGTPASFPVGTNPIAIAIADFNGDGKLDISVACYVSNCVSVLLGNGNGSFGASQYFQTYYNPRSLTSADFNGDGKIDLVVACQNHMSILFGNGIGGFTGSTDLNYVISNQLSVISADFNGDGKADLAMSDINANHATVYLGTGTGSFGTEINCTYAQNCGSGTNSVCGADFNGDGKADLAVGSYGGCGVSVFLHGLIVDPAQTICSGNAAFLSATGASNYTWSSNAGSAITDTVSVFPTSVTTYTVTGTNGVCSETKTTTIAVNPSPTVTLIASDTTFCGAASAITFTASGANSYFWNNTGQTTSSITFTPQYSTGVSVIGTNSFGCTNQKTVGIIINPLPTITISKQTTVCAYPSTTNLFASGANTYLWSNSQTGISISVSPAVNTNYTVTGTDTNGCSAASNVMAGPNPTANFNYTVNNMTVGFTMIDPTDGTSGGFLWDYGNGMTSTIAQQPFVTYNNAGTYTACLQFNSIPNTCIVCANITVPGNYTGSSVGIIENDPGKSISIYPNPFNLQTTIKFSEEQKNTTIKIMDVVGKEINSINYSGKELIIEKGGMKEGIYFVQIIDSNKIVMNRKIVVQ